MMRQMLFLMLLAAGTLSAQEPVATMYDHQVTLVENDVLSLAEAMPADKYDFAPTNGNFAGVRTFGEQVKHLATMIFMTSARVLEERSPYGPGTHNNGPDDVRSKAEIIAFLKDSIAYARTAMASLTTDNHLTPVASAFGQKPRAAVAAGVAFHSFNHYGQMVVYARMNGIVPPASVPTGDEPVR
ncbi:MAG: DinB family protein [Vicinamibacterales bacterium]|jgi:hypothetical protein|nr:DinB family protein [Vicinamibacterales bacterium]